ncbi:PemK-like protein [Calothrix sp. NIES-4071]|nr:PemK-like protein [Calothrix sp. NIES-4071]BAZ62374.1 PemK-like protein [Calothrix sp. NIES-4105]
MTIKRGEIWLADLNPTRGSEQGGNRPVIIFQNDVISQFSRNFNHHSSNYALCVEYHYLPVY